jgi:hypothetical protein
MQNSSDTFLNENLQMKYKETRIINTVETQINEPIEDPEKNFGRLKEYFEFLLSPERAEDNIETNITK